MAYIGKSPSTKFSAAAKVDTFTGDGSTTTFDLANIIPAGGENGLQVFVNNVRQKPGASNAFTVGNDGSGDLKRITFSSAPVASAEIYVINPTLSPEVVQTAESSKNLETSAITSKTELSEVAADDDVLLLFDTSAGVLKKIQKSNIATILSYVTRNYTGDGSTSTFTVTSGTAVDNVIVTENGVVQVPTTDYQISGTTLTFQGGAPASGVAIQIRELPR